MRVEDLFDEVSEFEKLLEAAEEGAVSDWEMDFVSDIQDKYKKYGRRMYVSDAQLSRLEKIADQ